MDVVFCGTPQFAVPNLRALVDNGFRVRLVVTQPDRPSGRGLALVRSPVKKLAMELGLPIAQPERIKNNAEFRALLESIAPKAIVVVGYGRIIPSWMINLPQLGNINVHASLLPKYRGAAPVQWAIAMGEKITGVTTMRIDAGLDTGDMLLQNETEIRPEDNAETLAVRLSNLGAPLLVDTLRGLEAGILHPRPQDNAQATLAPVLKKEDGRIDFSRTATDIWNRLRGFQPWPGAFTSFRGKSLQIWAAEPVLPARGLEPGQVRSEPNHLYVGCGGESMLEVFEVQLEGKKRVPAVDFANGYRPKAGEKFVPMPDIVAPVTRNR